MKKMMPKMKKSLFARLFGRIRRDERGAITMEYGLLALLIAAALVVAVMLFSTQVKNLFVATVKIGADTSQASLEKTIKESNSIRIETKTKQVSQTEKIHDDLADTSAK